MPVRRPPTALATMNATVGSEASTMPRQPPSCSSTRCRSKVGPEAASRPSPAGTSVTRRSPGAQLVPGVVDDLPAVEGGEATAGGQPAPRLDAGDAPAAQPHEG